MAPQMAGTVHTSSVFVMFLLVFPVFCFSNKIKFTRDELLNIRQNTPHNIFPDFDYSYVLLDIVVGGAALLFRCFRTRGRGKRGFFKTPLPSIHLANLRCLPIKWTNSFCSPGRIRISQTLLLCVSRKPL